MAASKIGYRFLALAQIPIERGALYQEQHRFIALCNALIQRGKRLRKRALLREHHSENRDSREQNLVLSRSPFEKRPQQRPTARSPRKACPKTPVCRHTIGMRFGKSFRHRKRVLNLAFAVVRLDLLQKIRASAT